MLERLVTLLGAESLSFGYGFVFCVLLLCGFGLPMPEDIVLVTGGVLAWLASPLERLSLAGMMRDRGLLTMIAVGLGGILAGDSVIFLAGRRFGARVADFRPLRRIITPAKLELVERKISHRGNVVVMFARFLPGLRVPTYFTVGHARMPYWRFALYDGVAALVSAPLWVCVGFWFGSDLQKAARVAAQFGHYILLAVAVVLVAITVRWWTGRRAVELSPAVSAEDPDETRGTAPEKRGGAAPAGDL